MKSILVLTCCLALVSVAAAADLDKHKKKQANQAQQQQVQQQQVIKPAKHRVGGGAAARLQTQPGTHTSANTGLYNSADGTPHLKNKNASGHGKTKIKADSEGAAQSNLPAAQSNTHVGKMHVKHFNVQNNGSTKIEAVKFKENHHIEGSEKWQGKKYQAFKNYNAQWHDKWWWKKNHNRIVFIGGGWYYWNTGWWYPAWGYEPTATFVYDGPIYAYNDLDPGQVVANVQAALQEQGYYEGEVDGLLGPLTRAALARYQADHGLYTTAAIDEPTLESLGFS
ncbi:MAG: peptidoglycan-binding protein [Verrucomicrobiota bacterium]|nr:peptidoglycan-binding protein [Verrucomicrobiota bacterium]